MKKLAAYLAKHGMTQREFAELAEVDPSVICRLLKGQRRVSYSNAVLIEKASKKAVRIEDIVA